MQRRVTVVAIGALSLALVGLHFGVKSYTSDRALAQQREPAQQSAPPAIGTSDEQKAILADGVVTEDEVRGALSRAADCLEFLGVQAVRVGHPQLEGNLELMVYVPDGGDFAKTKAAMNECATKHSALVTSSYRAQTRGANASNPLLGPDGWPAGGPGKPR